MKKIVLSLCFLSITLLAQAQVDFSLGLRAGGNIVLNKLETSVGQSLSGGTKYTPGFTAGVVANLGLGSMFSIQPEVLYTRKSVKYTEGDDYLRLDVNTIEIPILAKVSFGDNVRFFVNAGPYVDYTLNGKVEISYLGDTYSETFTPDKNADGRLEYGVTGGLGVAIPAGPGSLLLEGRYNYGLGNDAQGRTADYESTQVATLSVTYLFSLGGR